MIEIQDYPIYTPIPSGCKLLGTDETGATKNFSIQDVMKTLKSSDYTVESIEPNCSLIGANSDGETKSFLFSDIISKVNTKNVRVLSKMFNEILMLWLDKKA
jgi:Cdc6-like AAA superfamily ATPase